MFDWINCVLVEGFNLCLITAFYVEIKIQHGSIIHKSNTVNSNQIYTSLLNWDIPIKSYAYKLESQNLTSRFRGGFQN